MAPPQPNTRSLQTTATTILLQHVLGTERHMITGLVGALAYGVCHDAVEPQVYRSIDPTASR